MKRRNFPNRKEKRREEGKARQAKWDAMSNEERLATLEARDQGTSLEAKLIRLAIEKG